jgi:hypothetical protein
MADTGRRKQTPIGRAEHTQSAELAEHACAEGLEHGHLARVAGWSGRACRARGGALEPNRVEQVVRAVCARTHARTHAAVDHAATAHSIVKCGARTQWLHDK